MYQAGDLQEITVPETEPATEWILGEAVQKVSPKRRHALLQAALVGVIRQWSRGRGDAGTEWRFRISPPGERPRPLVPDIAYLSNERKTGLTGDDLEVPRVAPDLVVEILSPDDRADRVASKRETYLAAGTRLVIVVDPDTRTLHAYDAAGCATFVEPATFSSTVFPELEIDLAEIFREISAV
ncbi:MAG: Uma2 family endonuclease [Candidatus Eremiobacteraeota bacterium]|nr:Uma2 family endonuclease [Candidatus Eremiobacteraeota bacterium]